MAIVIAVAGGTGGVGSTLTKVLNADTRFKVLVLSRKAGVIVPKGATLITVDYASTPALKAMLEKHQVHTIVSALYDEAGAEQLRLIEAAKASLCTKRFIASDWGCRFPADAVDVLPFVAWRFKAIEELRKSQLEWTVVHTGYFMDYYGRSCNKSGPPFVVDVFAKVAAIPGTGDEYLALTHTRDVGRFVAELLALEMGQWEETTYLFGERVTWNQVVKEAEGILETKFVTSYENMEELKQHKVTELPGHEAVGSGKDFLILMFAVFGLYVVDGRFDVPPERALNTRFPEILPISLRQFLQISFGKGDVTGLKQMEQAQYCII